MCECMKNAGKQSGTVPLFFKIAIIKMKLHGICEGLVIMCFQGVINPLVLFHGERQILMGSLFFVIFVIGPEKTDDGDHEFIFYVGKKRLVESRIRLGKGRAELEAVFAANGQAEQ